MSRSGKIKVLVVDDSAIVRASIQNELASQPDIAIVGLAPDPFVARDMLLKEAPDVILLDIEMPRMDGLTFLRKIMKHKPTPVIIVSSVTPKGCKTAMACLEAGAVEVLKKPDAAYSLGDLGDDLVRLIREIGRRGSANVARLQVASLKPVAEVATIRTTHQVVAIGASAGGPETVRAVLQALPANAPGIVIVQHMGPSFLVEMADRLNRLSRIQVKLGTDGASVLPGQALLAPGDKHMTLRRTGGRYEVRLEDGDRISGHKPAVDALMHSVAKAAGANAMGVMLTGMGDDGATGMKAMYDAGSYNIAQDEKTCIVFGMPARAIEAGGVADVLPLDAIPSRIMEFSAGRCVRRSAA